MMSSVEKVKILVVGDSGVGKTSLVQLICHNEPTSNPGWTIGCSVEVKLHEYKAGTPAEKTYFLELWDVGGSTSHTNSRSIFYNPVHGVILVHDQTNRKSHQNLRKWLGEVLNKDNMKVLGNGLLMINCTDPDLPVHYVMADLVLGSLQLDTIYKQQFIGRYEYDPEQFAGSQVPILVIGTKLDLAESIREKGVSRSSSIAEECGADEINLDCQQVKSLAPGSTNAVKLSRFFDKVIEKRFNSGREGHFSPTIDRRRFGKNSHVD